jgi:endo-1,3(4)-beta-glucanase
MSLRHSYFISILLLASCGGGGGGSSSTGGDNDPNPTPVDTTPPVITLVGDSTISHEQGTTFSEPGATASDAVDGTVSVTISGSVGAAAGSYTLTYSASDSSGNTASTNRTVNVADTTPPLITLVGDSTINHEQGTTYNEPGATANDVVDGAVNVTISGSVGAAAGSYTLTYSATDSVGNTASTNRTVIVADTQAPQINLNQQSQMSLNVGDTFTDPGATATDVVDGAVTVTTSGTVDTSTAGQYSITYSATDAAGNSASASLTVTVSNGAPNLNDGDGLLVLSDGLVADIWGGQTKFAAFDSASTPAYSNCIASGVTDNCPSIDWQVVSDAEYGDVLQVTYSANTVHAGLVIGPSAAVNLSDYAQGNLEFDLKIINAGNSNLSGGFLVKIETTPALNSGELAITGIDVASNAWQSVSFPVSSLTASGAINLSSITVPLVLFPAYETGAGLVYQIDNVRYTGIADGATPPTEPTGGSGSGGGDNGNPSNYTLKTYGAGSVAETIYTASHRCKEDWGYWVENAGVISTQSDIQILGCDQSTGTPTGVITKLYPQLTGPAAAKPTQTHKWWGSVAFWGEMTVGDANDAAYITPDPITARITNKGVRVMSIPSGLRVTNENQFYYAIPDHAAEIFDGIAVANSDYANLEAYLKDHSAGSVTVMWKSADTDVMEATFVHGSPYIYFKAYEGDLMIRTLRADGGEKGIFYNQNNSLGVWTSVASNVNNFLIVGEGATSFSNTAGNEIVVTNAAKELTLTYLPASGAGTASATMISDFASRARNVVAAVDIDYSVDTSTNKVTVSRQYLDSQGNLIQTMAGMHPLHWKHSSQVTTGHQIRSARGMIKFADTNQFDYQLQFIGVLPTLPYIANSLDQAKLEGLVTDFVSQGSAAWNTATDTYWAGKNYGKVAELAAIARSIGMQTEADQLINWLKEELADWFTAETDGQLNTKKYFVYDDDWNTLFGFDEAYGSHQRLADHHFHYGYFVRAAAEICRVDLAWCGQDQYGPMIELLIRDYAADDDDDMFPQTRNFDPANGFSWADGRADAIRGNNNESTSEAATAYGAIVLYGLATGNTELTEKGMYMHASTGATYWEYWNNIDGWNNVSADADNFPPGYNRITTSIIWGDGADFATWFSGAFAHILGIQGLPTSPLIFHVGLYADYMEDYVTLGLDESSNGKPSGLPEDRWRDIWWNLWAMTDGDAAVADYDTVASYNEEAGETKAHTYHWINTFKALGTLKTGTGVLTADYPAAVAFEKGGVTSYVVYNYSNQAKSVSFSDGQTVNASANGFTVVTQ